MAAYTDPGMKIPGGMARLPLDKHHRPVPWFVAWIGGVPDFRVVKPGAIQQALRHRLCWVCGLPFQRQEDRAFVIGPMCAVNRVSSEPPSHEDCGAYSAMVCPFLATPRMGRRERHKPAGAVDPAGIMIRRNPGVALVWVTGYRSWSTTTDQADGTLFDIGEPKRARWFAHGRDATRDEALASIDSGLPILREMAEQDGPAAVELLDAQHAAALKWLPAGEASR